MISREVAREYSLSQLFTMLAAWTDAIAKGEAVVIKTAAELEQRRAGHEQDKQSLANLLAELDERRAVK